MPQATYSISLSVGGVTIQPPPIVRTFDHPNSYEATLPAGKAGTLTTRTDADTGEATLGSGHGITTGMIVDVYWSGGRRYGMTVGTVASLVVPLDGGTGDAFPIATTALVVTPHVNINTAIDGDNISIIGLMLECALDTGALGHISFFDDGDAEIAEFDLTRNDPIITDVEGGAANPYTGNPITYARATNSSSTASATLKIASGEDSTP